MEFFVSWKITLQKQGHPFINNFPFSLNMYTFMDMFIF